MNFLKTVLQKLDDQSMGLLGAVLGETEGKVRDGVTSAIPKVLDAMVAISKDEEGRNMLWRELRDTDASIANNFSQQLFYKDSQSLVEMGRDQLDGLMGTEATRLVQAVSRDSDIGSTKARRLVGAVTPLVFASMADHLQSKKLDQKELANVIVAQVDHLRNWKQQDLSYFPSDSQPEEDDSPLFNSPQSDTTTENFIPPNDEDSYGSKQDDDSKTGLGSKTAAAAATASAALAVNHLRDAANDGTDGSGKDFDQRHQEHHQREAIAINPANKSNDNDLASSDSASFEAGSSDSDSSDSDSSDIGTSDSILTDLDPNNANDLNATNSAESSKSEVEKTIAATGVSAAGVAAEATSTFSKDASTSDSSTDVAYEKDAVANTYDSKNAVSGFAADTSISGNNAVVERDTATESGEKRLWTPESADRDENGNLKYASTGVSANTLPRTSTDTSTDTSPLTSTSTNVSSATATGGKQSGGWFHWLWWPVLIFGSLLAAGMFLIDQDGLNTQRANPNDADSPVVSAPNEDEDDAKGQSQVTSDVENVNKDNADQVGSGIQADSNLLATSDDGTVSDDEDVTDNGAASDDEAVSEDTNESSDGPDKNDEAKSKKAKDQSTSDVAADDSDEDEATEPDSQTQSEDPSSEDKSAITNTNQDSEASSGEDLNVNDATQEDLADPASETDEETASQSNDDPDVSETVAADDDLEILDADEQVEEVLSEIETKLNGVDNEAKATAVKPTLTQQVTELKKVLADREQWKDEIEILVDFQLEEGKKMLAKNRKKMFKSKEVKNTLDDLFEKLDELLTPAAQ